MLELTLHKAPRQPLQVEWNTPVPPASEEIATELKREKIRVISHSSSDQLILKPVLEVLDQSSRKDRKLRLRDAQDSLVSEISFHNNFHQKMDLYGKETAVKFRDRGLSQVTTALACAVLKAEGYITAGGNILFNNESSIRARFRIQDLSAPNHYFSSYITPYSLEALESDNQLGLVTPEAAGIYMVTYLRVLATVEEVENKITEYKSLLSQYPHLITKKNSI